MEKELRFSDIINAADMTKGNGRKELRDALSMETATKVLDIVSPMLEKLVLAQAGATVFRGLDPKRQYRVPVASGNPAHWLNVAGGEVAFPTVDLEPHTLVCKFEVSSQLLQQTGNLALEKYLIDLATSGMAVEIEKAVLGTTDTDDRPVGLFNVAGALVPTHAGMVDLVHAIEAVNTSGTFVLNADIAQSLRKVEKVGGYVMEGNNIAGFPALVSNSASGLAFGAWRDLVIGLFDDMWIISDPYTLAVDGVTIVSITFSVAAHLLRDTSVVRVVAE